MENLDFNKNGDGLIPVIIQDNASLKVLMLGYMNEKAYTMSTTSRMVTFYSRTRDCIWVKGETSGNYLTINSIEADCDNDTLLIRVTPAGPTCHTGAVSCFNDNNTEGFIRQLEKVIKQRHTDMPEGSYTTHLFNKGVNKMAQKVGEEAVETVIEAIACNDERLIYEASDLIYHLIVLLVSKGFSISDIENELAKRHK